MKLKWLCFFVAMHPMAALAESCSDVLPSDGAIQWSNIYKDEASSLVVAAHFAKMTYKEIKSHLDRGGSIEIADIGSLGADSSETEIQTFLEKVNQRDDLTELRESTLSILSRSGDPVVANIWLECMLASGGVRAYFDPRTSPTDLYALLSIEYIEGHGDDDKLTFETPTLGDHNRWRNWFINRKIIRGGSIKGGSRKSPGRVDDWVQRRSASDPFWASISFKNHHRSVIAYLPATPTPPTCKAGEYTSLKKEYYSAPNREVVIAGGSLKEGALDRARLTINEDCSSTIEYAARAAFDNHVFPDSGTAPWLKIVLTDHLGNPISDKLVVDNATDKDNIGAFTQVDYCGEENLHKLVFQERFNPRMSEQVGGFNIVLSDSEGRASPGPCPPKTEDK